MRRGARDAARLPDPQPFVVIADRDDEVFDDGDPAHVAAIVVGRPVRLDGRESPQTAEVDAFVARLRARTALPVFVQDERLTSVEAEARLAEREPDWRRRKARLDAAAAAVILQDFLDAADSGAGAAGAPRD